MSSRRSFPPLIRDVHGRVQIFSLDLSLWSVSLFVSFFCVFCFCFVFLFREDLQEEELGGLKEDEGEARNYKKWVLIYLFLEGRDGKRNEGLRVHYFPFPNSLLLVNERAEIFSREIFSLWLFLWWGSGGLKVENYIIRGEANR